MRSAVPVSLLVPVAAIGYESYGNFQNIQWNLDGASELWTENTNAKYDSDGITIAPAAPPPEEAKEFIRNMARHTWKNYKENAFGHDEVTPEDGHARDNWGGHAVTLVDSLSTLYIMKLYKEFEEGVEFLDKNLINMISKHSGTQSLFETNIRLLGGLNGAHSLAYENHPELAAKLLPLAKEVGNRFMPAFKDRLLPCGAVDLSNGNTASCESHNIAEAGTLTMEFRYLSYHTGDSKYAQVADRAMRGLMNSKKDQGLLPNHVYVDNSHEALRDQHVNANGYGFSLGAEGDSYYEYLLKTYLLGCKADEDRDMLQKWRLAMWEASQQLVTNITSRTAVVHSAGSHDQEHLACFVPGMLMLGHETLKNDQSVPEQEKNAWKDMANKIGTHCAESYSRSSSGLGLERFDNRYHGLDDRFILRPETAESMFYLLRFTKDEQWRDRSFQIAKALEKHAKRDYGYTSLGRLNQAGQYRSENKQESFFFAELMKYLYLAHTSDDEFDPTKFILTTEAHPLCRFCDTIPAYKRAQTDSRVEVKAHETTSFRRRYV